MQKHSISEIDILKLSYYDIINGYSYNSELNLYFKHFTEYESYLLLQKKIELYSFYKEVPTEQELLKNALESGDWTETKENKILEIKYAISDNERLLINLIPQQRAIIENILETKRKELREFQYERKHLLGRSLEDLIDEDVNDYVTYLVTFKNAELTIKLEDSYDKFEEWDLNQVQKISQILGIIYNQFSEENLELISCMPFFLNKLSYCKEHITEFLGKPINQLSHNQHHILSTGVKNLNTLSRTENQPPDLNLDCTPQQLAHWYKIQYGIQLAKSKQSNISSSGNSKTWHF